MTDGVIFDKLDAAGPDRVGRFRMDGPDEEALQIFLRRHARRSAEAGLTTTYVAKETASGDVVGYVTLMCAEVALEDGYRIKEKPGAERWRWQPAVRIARLGVIDRYRGTGIGRSLVDIAIGIVREAIAPRVGCRFVILDAKNKSIPFYEKMGFRLLDTQTNRDNDTPLMFMDLKTLPGAES